MKRTLLILFLSLVFGLTGLSQKSKKSVCECDSCVVKRYNKIKELKEGETTDFCVRARKPWNHSGIRLLAGVKYEIDVLPPDTFWCDASLRPFGPCRRKDMQKYYALLRKPDTVWFALIGSIGKKRKRYFKIGKELVFTASHSGELLCFANDVRGFYSNNRGVLTLRIKRITKNKNP